MICILQDFGLRRITLAPFPFLLQFLREGIGVLHAFNIAAGAGIAIPVPCTANIPALLVNTCGQTEFAQLMKHIEAREPGPDNDGVIDGSCRALLLFGHLLPPNLLLEGCCSTSVAKI